MADILKLPNVGDEHTGTVTRFTEVEGAAGPQVQCDFADGKRIYLPAETAVRQLVRLGFDGGKGPDGKDRADFEAAEGNTFRFYRTENKNPKLRPYWNIDIADGVDIAASKAPPSKRMTQEDAVRALDLEPHPKTATTTTAAKSWDTLRAQYLTCYAAALDILGKLAEPGAAQAMAFSLYKAARDEHITVPVKVTPIATAPVKVNPKALPDPADDESDSSLPF